METATNAVTETSKAKRSGLSWANAHRLAADHDAEILVIAARAFAAVARGERLLKR